MDQTQKFDIIIWVLKNRLVITRSVGHLDYLLSPSNFLRGEKKGPIQRPNSPTHLFFSRIEIFNLSTHFNSLQFLPAKQRG